MKKIVSIVMTVAMLLSMASLSVFADAAPDYTSIDSVEEYVEFAKAVDAGTYTNNADHKVTVDLDFTGYNAEDVVITNQVGDLQLNFQGHTVSGLVREVTLADHGNVGLLIDNAGNYVEVLNVKIKDCKLVVNCPSNDKGYEPWAMVGGVIGRADRAYVNSVDFENVTIELNGPGAVGLAYGEKTWQDWRGPDISIATKNVVVNAPKAEGVGLVIGRMGDVDGDTITVTKLDVTNTTITSKNEISASAYVGTGSASHISLKDGVTPTVTLVDNATGYQPPKAEPAAPVVPDSWGYEGFEDHHGNNDVYYVMWAEGAECWARMKGNGSGDYPDMENNKYTVTVNGTEYECTYMTMFDGGEWGYLRFKLTGTGFDAKFNTSYNVNWKVEAKDGSWAYTGTPVDMLCFCGEKPAAEALVGDALATIQGMTNLTGKVNQDSVDTNVGTYNDTTETEKSVFDGDLTNKMGSGDTNVTLTWSTTEAITVTDYVMVSGNDVEANSSRNPLLWTLYGSNDGETWTVIDTVSYAGFEAKNSTAYGFHVDNPGAYTQYKLELKSKGGFELGEMTLYNNPAPVVPDQTEDEPAKTGDALTMMIAVSTVALVAVAFVVSKKRSYNA